MARRPGVAPKLAMVHSLPLEMYPPAMNIARYFAQRGWNVSVHTTRNLFGLPDLAGDRISIHRLPASSSSGAAARVLRSTRYQVATARRLRSDKPDVILYFEPQSALPVYLSGLFRKTPLFIHHHEYHEPHEFQRPGMRLARLAHGVEKSRLFPAARWISHTNAERLARFLRDNPEVSPEIGRVLPNLPPRSWSEGVNHAWEQYPPPPLRLVYAGSLSVGDSYIAELVAWIRAQPALSVTLDVFCYNADEETRRFLQAADESAEVIAYHPRGVAYDDMPRALRHFHTGVILYKPQTENYRHNASNKLFEYLACGLDVVFPSRALGVKPYIRSDSLPRVIEADFDNLDELLLSTLSHRGGQPERPFDYTAESALGALEAAMRSAAGNPESGAVD